MINVTQLGIKGTVEIEGKPLDVVVDGYGVWLVFESAATERHEIRAHRLGAASGPDWAPVRTVSAGGATLSVFSRVIFRRVGE